MTPLTRPAASTRPACTGLTHGVCTDCDRRMHRARQGRRCDQGHPRAGSHGRCVSCASRRWRAERRPVPLPRGTRIIPTAQRGTMLAPCTRCDQIARLPLGPGPALCPPCDTAEILDLVGRR